MSLWISLDYVVNVLAGVSSSKGIRRHIWEDICYESVEEGECESACVRFGCKMTISLM